MDGSAVKVDPLSCCDCHRPPNVHERAEFQAIVEEVGAPLAAWMCSPCQKRWGTEEAMNARLAAAAAARQGRFGEWFSWLVTGKAPKSTPTVH